MKDHTEPVTASATIVRADAVEINEHDWGRILFFASENVGSAAEQSLGRCEINPGASLPKHYHPNCSEIVHVVQGMITHTIEDDRVETLRVGDTVIVPRNFAHQAINVGDEPAVLLISFSASRRDFVVVES